LLALRPLTAAVGRPKRGEMPSWFKYDDRTAERLSEFVSLILDTLKAHICSEVMPI
jgi:hypothetical protein